MIVLDENVLSSQRLALAARHLRLCQIGVDVGRKGIKDDEIVALLRQIRRPSFFSRDRDFFRKALCSEQACLAQLDVGPLQVAEYIRRLLRHTDFRTWSQRRGCVLKISVSGISIWRAHAPRVVRVRWVAGR